MKEGIILNQMAIFEFLCNSILKKKIVSICTIWNECLSEYSIKINYLFCSLVCAVCNFVNIASLLPGFEFEHKTTSLNFFIGIWFEKLQRKGVKVFK